jgi:hypothetical protein
MKIRFVMTAMVLGASMLTSEAMFAAPKSAAPKATVTTVPSAHTAYSNAQQVKFHMSNGSAATLTMKAGDKEITMAPGSEVSVKLAVGTPIVAESTSTHYAAGSLLAVVGDSFSGATLHIN